MKILWSCLVTKWAYLSVKGHIYDEIWSFTLISAHLVTKNEHRRFLLGKKKWVSSIEPAWFKRNGPESTQNGNLKNVRLMNAHPIKNDKAWLTLFLTVTHRLTIFRVMWLINLIFLIKSDAWILMNIKVYFSMNILIKTK